MRTKDQIDKIKSQVSPPFEVKELLTNDEVKHLIDLFENSKVDANAPVVYKNTGPITLDLKLFLDDQVVSGIVDKLREIIGPFEITASFFFFTNYPHIIHNDDTFELPESVYKGITIPLRIDGPGIPKLCFFDQFYFHGPAKFFNGDTDVPTYYNKCVYEYSELDGVVDKKFNGPENMFRHLKKQWLTGLSLNSIIDWKPGNAIVFDSTRLHCASDFRQQGIKSKLGISIFTKKTFSI